MIHIPRAQYPELFAFQKEIQSFFKKKEKTWDHLILKGQEHGFDKDMILEIVEDVKTKG